MKKFRGKYKFTPSCLRITQKIYNASIMLEYRLGIFMQNYRCSLLVVFTIVRIFCMKWLNNSILQNNVRNLYCELMNLTYYFLMKLNYGYLFKDMLKVRWGIFLLLHYFRIEWILLPQLQSLYSSKVCAFFWIIHWFHDK